MQLGFPSALGGCRALSLGDAPVPDILNGGFADDTLNF